jgi:hypothetical protein
MTNVVPIQKPTNTTKIKVTVELPAETEGRTRHVPPAIHVQGSMDIAPGHGLLKLSELKKAS